MSEPEVEFSDDPHWLRRVRPPTVKHVAQLEQEIADALLGRRAPENLALQPEPEG